MYHKSWRKKFRGQLPKLLGLPLEVLRFIDHNLTKNKPKKPNVATKMGEFLWSGTEEESEIWVPNNSRHQRFLPIEDCQQIVILDNFVAKE